MAKITLKKPFISSFHKNETVAKTLVITADALGLTTDDSFRLRIRQQNGAVVFDETFPIYDDGGTLKSDIKITPADTDSWTVDKVYEYQIELVIANPDEDNFIFDEKSFRLLNRIE